MKSLRELPSSLVDLLNSPPPAGSGIHQWIASCAWKLCRLVSPEQAHELLAEAALACDREDPSREINGAIQSALLKQCPSRAKAQPWGKPRRGTHPDPDWTSIASIAARGEGMKHLVNLSRDTQSRSCWEWLSLLFPGNPLLCLATNPKDARTRRLSQWIESGVTPSLIVPSPMCATMARNAEGKRSHRCLNNTGQRRYLVVEFDFKPDAPDAVPTPAGMILVRMAAESPPRTATDLCAALLLDLQRMGAPLVLVVHSGGKSLHGWFNVVGKNDDELKPFFHACRRLNADPATLVRCQPVRLPEGTRRHNGDSCPQPVLVFDSSHLPTI